MGHSEEGLHGDCPRRRGGAERVPGGRGASGETRAAGGQAGPRGGAEVPRWGTLSPRMVPGDAPPGAFSHRQTRSFPNQPVGDAPAPGSHPAVHTPRPQGPEGHQTASPLAQGPCGDEGRGRRGSRCPRWRGSWTEPARPSPAALNLPGASPRQLRAQCFPAAAA